MKADADLGGSDPRGYGVPESAAKSKFALS
jgi:hypothetical protein